MPLVLVIDQSTSATKVILFDEKGRMLDKASREHRQIYPQPGWVEHDAEEIWRNTLTVIRELVERDSTRVPDIAALSITNQRETVLVFDRRTGEPLHNAVVWQCRRGDALCQNLRQRGYEKQVRLKTGLKIDTYFSASKVAWFMENRPVIAAKLRSGEAVVGTMDAYLIHRLTRGATFATDHTNASRTLLYDIAHLQWDEELCELFQAPIRALPEVRESSAHFGVTNAEGILPRELPIVGVMGDSQGALFAQRCFQPGQAKATFGTGTSVMLNIGDEFKTSDQGAVTALAWVWRGQPTYAFEGIINFSAATIEWLKNQLGMIRDADEVEALACAVDDNGGVYLVPAFAGLSAPYWAPDAKAAIVGMTAYTKREHIVRAAQEAIAYQIRDVLDMMRTGTTISLQALCADGGPTRNRFLMQFTADLTGAELTVAQVAECSAWGAASKALLGLGVCRTLDELAAQTRISQSFHPHMDATQVKHLHDGWTAAVARTM